MRRKQPCFHVVIICVRLSILTNSEHSSGTILPIECDHPVPQIQVGPSTMSAQPNSQPDVGLPQLLQSFTNAEGKNGIGVDNVS